MLLSEITAVTKTGNKILTYFETAQGSKYLLSDKGESKRIKSLHANTGAEDVGVKEWMQHCVFTDPKDEKMANAFQFLANHQKDIMINVQSGKITLMIVEDKKWRDATFADAYPTSSKSAEHSSKKNDVLTFGYIKDPKIGYNCVEFNIRANKTVSNYHFGSPVSKIKKVSDMSETELKAFASK